LKYFASPLPEKRSYIEEALPEDNRSHHKHDCRINFYGRRILDDPLCLPAVTFVSFIDKAGKIFVRLEEGALSHSIAHHR